MKAKRSGVSVLIAMGTSTLVLTLAFATLDSVARSIEQASNIQRSTQLFFASESGVEASFFHHNSRGAGLNFNTSHASQSIDHANIQAQTDWSIVGRTVDSISGNPALGGILKEGQSVQIPLSWDSSANPTSEPNNNGNPDSADELQISFYKDTEDIPTGDVKDKIVTEGGTFAIPTGFDFGDSSPDPEVLIDWSFARKNSAAGVQTFIPTENDSCGGAIGFICEDQLLTTTQSITTNTSIDGKILPGGIITTLNDFWSCSDPGVSGTCSDYRATFRPLLKLVDTKSTADESDDTKIPGIPYTVVLQATSTGSFPRSFYTVEADVSQEDFSQRISIDVAEKTSIGAFDYVIFD